MQSEEQWIVIYYCPACRSPVHGMDGERRYSGCTDMCLKEEPEKQLEIDDRSDEEKYYPNLNEEDYRKER